MKKILVLSFAIILPIFSFAQRDYWKDNFTVISNMKYGNYEITLEKKIKP